MGKDGGKKRCSSEELGAREWGRKKVAEWGRKTVAREWGRRTLGRTWGEEVGENDGREKNLRSCSRADQQTIGQKDRWEEKQDQGGEPQLLHFTGLDVIYAVGQLSLKLSLKQKLPRTEGLRF